MKNVSPYGVITDDPLFASVMTSMLSTDGSYFPVISMPRMTRDDWTFEVRKRAKTISRTDLQILFTKSEEYGLLAPLRDSVKPEVIALDSPQDTTKFLDFDSPKETLTVPTAMFRSGLIQARMGKKILHFSSEQIELTEQRDELILGSETLVIVERTKEVNDVAAINYALAKGYDILFVGMDKSVVQRWEYEKRFKNLCTTISENLLHGAASFDALTALIQETIDFKALEKRYKRIQFVVSSVPLGILIKSIPVAHLFHLQADLRLLDEFHYVDTDVEKGRSATAYFFVDTDSADLISEIPSISEKIASRRHWAFHLNGKHANRDNFRTYTQFLPFDVLFVSGHGSSPECREVVYKFQSRDGSTHEGRFVEFFQFGKVLNGNIEVERRLSPIAFDGILWTDKKGLSDQGIDHLFYEFSVADEKHRLQVVSSKDINPRTIQGLLLADGVFMGNIRSFANGDHPVVILNTCGSLLEIGDDLSFAGARGIIGSMWVISDREAGEFAKHLFESLEVETVATSFHKARSKIQSEDTATAYAYFGTLNDRVPPNNDEADEMASKAEIVERLIRSFSEVPAYLAKGFLSMSDIETLRRLHGLTDTFVEKDLPSRIDLRTRLKSIAPAGILNKVG